MSALLDLAMQIAAHLGPDWRAAPGWVAFTDHTILHGPSDQRLDIKSGNSSHRKSDRGKLFICCECGQLQKHLDRGKQPASITVTDTHPARTIAMRIARDLLPGFGDNIARCRARAREADAAEARREATIEALCAVLPSARRVWDDFVYFGGSDSEISGRIRVLDAQSATFKIEVTPTRPLSPRYPVLIGR
jgi:hypothetical protein